MYSRTYSLNAIILSHFILDLRSIYQNPESGSNQTSTIKFAASIQGNLGASLDISWVNGSERDLEEEEESRLSDNPFATGLLESE